jgi:hypothetical protein
LAGILSNWQRKLFSFLKQGPILTVRLGCCTTLIVYQCFFKVVSEGFIGLSFSLEIYSSWHRSFYEQRPSTLQQHGIQSKTLCSGCDFLHLLSLYNIIQRQNNCSYLLFIRFENRWATPLALHLSPLQFSHSQPLK